MKRWMTLFGIIAIVLIAIVAYAYETANYMKQGGAEWVVGGNLTVSSGGTMTCVGIPTFSGGIVSTGDDVFSKITVTTLAVTHEDITSTGPITLDDGSGASPALIFKDGTDETSTFSKVDSGFLTITTQAADGVSVRVGNLTVGDGSPTHAQNGEDAYVEGMFEVDGVLYADGGVSGALDGIIGGSTPAAGTFTTVNGAAPIRVGSVNFYDEDVAASQSAAVWGMTPGANVGGTTCLGVVVPWAGSVIGISVHSNAACTSGTLTADATINGTATGLQAALDKTTHTVTMYNSQAIDADSFSAGDVVGVKVTTTSVWAPTTADVEVTVFYEW